MKRGILAIIATFAAVLVSFAAKELPVACHTALWRALDADAAWQMERTFPGSVRPLVSTGVVSCARFRGIVWDMRYPIQSTITMTTNAMVFADEEGMRIKDLADLPYYEEIRTRTDAFSRGDSGAFDGLFTWQVTTPSTNSWQLTLIPALAPLERLFTKIEVAGTDEITNVTWYTSGGGTIHLKFKELSRGTQQLWQKASECEFKELE